MNKQLINRKNPVLKFKLGRKIVKGADGLKATENGEQAYFLNNNGKVYIGHVNHLGSSGSKRLTHRYIVAGKLYGSFDGGKTYYGLSEGGRPLSYKANQKLLGKIEEINKSRNTVNTGSNVNTGNTRSTGSTPFYQFGKMGGWNRSIGSSIDQDSLNMIKEMGMEGKSARDILDEINRVFGSNAVKVDNKWGNLSRAGLKALYEIWQSLQPATTETKPAITQPSITQTPEFLERLRQQFIKEETPEQLTDRAIVNNVNNLQFRRNGNYNKSGIRDLIRSYGLKAYDFSGALRKALRQYLNGESNDTSLLTNGLERFIVPYKQGGQLPSRNIVERFKQRNFR